MSFYVQPNGGFKPANFFTHWWAMNNEITFGNVIQGGEGGAGDDFTTSNVFYTPDMELGAGELAAQNANFEKSERQTSANYSMGLDDAFTIAVSIKDGFGGGFQQFIGVNGATGGGTYIRFTGTTVGFYFFSDISTEGFAKTYVSPKLSAVGGTRTYSVFAVTYDGSGDTDMIRFYEDGIDVTDSLSTIIDNVIPANNRGENGIFRIGQQNGTSMAHDRYGGLALNMDRALEPEEVAMFSTAKDFATILRGATAPVVSVLDSSIEVSGGDPAFAWPSGSNMNWDTAGGATVTNNRNLVYDIDGIYTFSLADPNHTYFGRFQDTNNPNLVEVSLNEYAGFSDDWNLSGGTNLVRCNAPNIRFILRWWDMQNCPLLEEMDFRSVERAGRLNLYNCPELTTLRLDALRIITGGVSSGALHIYDLPKVTEINLPNLEFVLVQLLAQNNTLATYFNAPRLSYCQQISLSNSGYTYVDLNALTEVGDAVNGNYRIRINNCPDLDRVDLRSVTKVWSDIWISNNGTNIGGLSDFNIDSLVEVGGEIELINNQFTTEQVDYILSICATNNGGSPIICTDLRLELDGTNAAPSAVGEAHILTLRAAGWTVIVTGGF